jgi:ATP-binding cassette, subfamily B, heavy metal transporter
MRHHASAPREPNTLPTRSDWRVILELWPYVWAHKGRVSLAIVCLILAKVAVVSVPLVLKNLVDGLNLSTAQAAASAVVFVPLALVLAYGALRFATSLFTELREFLFVNVTQSTTRTLAKSTFMRLHELSLRFHLTRRTGQVTREIDHGVRGISSLINFTLYNIAPTLVEFALVIGYLAWAYTWEFSLIVLVSVSFYSTYTIMITNWRTHMRRAWNELETKAQSRAVDSLLNFETVKYFGNERWEAQRYDDVLANSEKAAVRSQQSLNVLNVGQQLIIGIALTLMVWRAVVGVQEGRMSLGDLVLVNAFLIQMYIPLNFLGVIYREMKQSLTDMERLFTLLKAEREVQDAPNAPALALRGAAVEFKDVGFAYETGDKFRPILQGLSLSIPAGSVCAVVGASGAGKSTLARLLFRFYDVQSGSITIDGQDLRTVTQASLRGAIGIVPQDTVLFNDTIGYNIGYGKPGCSQAEIEAAAKTAQIHDFILRLPDGYNTTVGERGLKLSGGEKQRVAIARTVLKNPALLILDEATSALDSTTEAAIQAQLKDISKSRTTLVIAHRLSTIVDADTIIVMDAGRVVEQGTFDALIAANGRFAAMWALQQAEV